MALGDRFGAPPFRNDRSAAGSAARQGPTALGETSIRLAREISEPLRSDLVRWADWRSRDRPGTDGDEEAVQSTDLRGEALHTPINRHVINVGTTFCE